MRFGDRQGFFGVTPTAQWELHCDGENSLASLTHIRIVVVEPAGALNLGSIARVMKNMGLGQLFLVNPIVTI